MVFTDRWAGFGNFNKNGNPKDLCFRVSVKIYILMYYFLPDPK